MPNTFLFQFATVALLLACGSGVLCAQTKLVDSLEQFVATHPADTNEVKALATLVAELMRSNVGKATG